MKQPFSNKTSSIGIILLAAGASRRMGSPKQLLKIDAQTLIERTIDLTQSIENTQTVVVLGANAEEIGLVIKKKAAINIIINRNWQKGMGTTLQKGLQFLLEKTPDLEAVLVLVCDQPYLTNIILQQLIDKYRQVQEGIIAVRYGGIIGVPALFSKALFPKLMQLEADEGARKIIKKHHGAITTIDFPKGIIDLDTPENYQQFLEKRKE